MGRRSVRRRVVRVAPVKIAPRVTFGTAKTSHVNNSRDLGIESELVANLNTPHAKRRALQSAPYSRHKNSTNLQSHI